MQCSCVFVGIYTLAIQIHTYSTAIRRKDNLRNAGLKITYIDSVSLEHFNENQHKISTGPANKNDF